MIQLSVAIAMAVSAAQPAAAPRLSAPEQAALNPALQAAQRQDWAATAAALPAARAAAQSPYARYVVGQLQLRIGEGTGDSRLQVQGMEEMLASGGAPAEQVGALLNNIVVLSTRAGDLAAAEQGLVRIVAREPGNLNRLLQLADLRNRMGRRDEALAAYRDAEPLLARQVEADLGNVEESEGSPPCASRSANMRRRWRSIEAPSCMPRPRAAPHPSSSIARRSRSPCNRGPRRTRRNSAAGCSRPMPRPTIGGAR